MAYRHSRIGEGGDKGPLLVRIFHVTRSNSFPRFSSDKELRYGVRRRGQCPLWIFIFSYVLRPSRFHPKKRDKTPFSLSICEKMFDCKSSLKRYFSSRQSSSQNGKNFPSAVSCKNNEKFHTLWTRSTCASIFPEFYIPGELSTIQLFHHIHIYRRCFCFYCSFCFSPVSVYPIAVKSDII